MTYSYHLPKFAKGLAGYLRDNFVGRLHTDIKTTKDTISITVYLYDHSFNDNFQLGEYISFFKESNEMSLKVKEEFKGHPFLMEGIHLLYENDQRKDSRLDIPFP